MDARRPWIRRRKFVEAYRVAKAAGLRLTSHCAETARPPTSPPAWTCSVVSGSTTATTSWRTGGGRALPGEGVTFTVCPTSTAVVYGWPDLTQHPITKMMDAGCGSCSTPTTRRCSTPTSARSTSGSAGRTTMAKGRPPAVLQGVDATWCDDWTRRRCAAASRARSDALDRELLASDVGRSGRVRVVLRVWFDFFAEMCNLSSTRLAGRI